MEWTDIAAFIEPYCRDGGRTKRGEEWYIRCDVGRTKGSARAWDYEAIECQAENAAIVAADLVEKIETQRRMEPVRLWIKVFRKGATNATADKEIRLDEREDESEDPDRPGKKRKGTMEDAINEGNVAKMVGHVMSNSMAMTRIIADVQGNELTRQSNRIIHLEQQLHQAMTTIEKVVTEREQLRSEKTIQEVKMGLFMADAIKQVAPMFADALGKWASGGNKPPPPPPPPTDRPGPAADATPASKPGPSASEVLRALLDGIGEIVEHNGDLAGEALDAIMSFAGTWLAKNNELITEARYHSFAMAYAKMAMYAQYKGYRPPPGFNTTTTLDAQPAK